MHERFSTDRFLAGLQTGMAGALVMLAWLALAMLWSRHSIWWFPNLMATTFGGDPALQMNFGKYTAAGLALHLIQYSVLGAVFALIAPLRGAPLHPSYTRLALLGLLLSLAFYYLMYDFVWKYWNPLIPLYIPDRAIVVAHVFFGMMLGRLPLYTHASAPVSA
jgi:hypothetical protein